MDIVLAPAVIGGSGAKRLIALSRKQKVGNRPSTLPHMPVSINIRLNCVIREARARHPIVGII